jgi:hypothetical protein
MNIYDQWNYEMEKMRAHRIYKRKTWALLTQLKIWAVSYLFSA